MVFGALHRLKKCGAHMAALILFAAAVPAAANTSLPVLPGEDDRVMAEVAATDVTGLPALVKNGGRRSCGHRCRA